MAEIELNVEQQKNLIHKLASPVYLGVGAVIFGLLLPPVGLVLAIITIYKAGQQQKRLPLALGILGVVAVVAGLFAISRLQTYLASNITQTYTYGNLAEHKVFLNEGSGITFGIPPELLPKSGDPRQTKAGQVNFTHNLTSRNGQPVFMSRQGVFIGKLANQNFNLNEVLGDQKNPEHQTFTDSLKTLVQSQSSAQNIAFSDQPKPFTNANISDSAWTIDFNGEQVSQPGKDNKLKGIIVIANGKNGTYYQMAITTLEKNWEPNQRSWQRILDSIKIDQ